MAEIVVEFSAILVLDTEKAPPFQMWDFEDMFNYEGVDIYDVALRVIDEDEPRH